MPPKILLLRRVANCPVFQHTKVLEQDLNYGPLMKENVPKSHPFKNMIGLALSYCRTILHFQERWLIPTGLALSMSACVPTSNNYYNNENKYLQPNANGESRGGGGTGDGGGGQGISCSDEVTDQRIKGRLLVRDIYEAITNHGRSLKSVNASSDNPDKIDPEAIKVLVDSIKHYFGPASKNLDFANEQFWTDFEKRISFTNDETPLNYSQDANSPISLPAGCKIVQIAFWHESSGPSDDGTLYVDQKHWRKLDNFNKVALLAHEFFFKQARQAGYTNSDYIRNKIGQLLSVKGEGLEPIFKEWVSSKDARVSEILPASMQGFKYCTGESEEDPSAKLQLYQYKGKDGLQHFVIPFLKSKSINISLLQSNHFSFNPGENPVLSKASDLWLYGSLKSCMSNDCLNKNFDSSEHELLWRKFWFEEELLTPPLPFNQETSPFLTLNNQPTLWSSQIRSNSEILQISIPNPAFSFSGPVNFKLKSSNEIINNIYVRVINEFDNFANFLEMRRKFDPENKSTPQDQNQHLQFIEQHKKNIITAISILNVELQSAMNAGIYPEEFPKWNAAIFSAWKFLGDFKKYNLIKSPTLQDQYLTKSLPYLLYKVKLNAHKVQDFGSELSNDDYLAEYPTFLGVENGIIQFRQGNLTLNYNLSCRDYKSVFSSASKKNVDLRTNVKMNPNIEVHVDDKDENIEELLSAIASIKSTQDIYNLLNSYHKFCRQNENTLGFNCNDLALLSNDLNRETKMSLNSCSIALPTLISAATSAEKKYVHTCYILRLESAKHRYQLVNSVPFSDISEQKIFFIRQIPYDDEDFESEKNKASEDAINNKSVFNNDGQ